MRTRRSAVSELSSGLGAMAVLGAIYWVTGSSIFVFLGVIFGLVPSIRGATRLLQTRVSAKEQKKIASANAETRERTVLRLARQEGGRLTPAIVAVNSALTLDDAEQQLRELADKGYAELHVTEDGRLEYVFAEFLARPPDDE